MLVARFRIFAARGDQARRAAIIGNNTISMFARLDLLVYRLQRNNISPDRSLRAQQAHITKLVVVLQQRRRARTVSIEIRLILRSARERTKFFEPER